MEQKQIYTTPEISVEYCSVKECLMWAGISDGPNPGAPKNEDMTPPF